MARARTPDLGERWWQTFGDAQLDALVARALNDHPSLQLAAARVARAQAVMERADAQRLPQLDARGDLLHQRYSQNGLYPPTVAGKVKDIGSVQAGFAWELDFFGRNRSALEAALGAERAAQAERASARVTLAANVVRVYVELAQLLAARQVAERTLEQRTSTLALVQRRVHAGIDTQVELRQSEGVIPDTRLAIELLDEQIALRRHALAALTVQAPDALSSLAPPLAALQGVPLPDTLPADLLGRRADIDAARRRIEAATADLDAARADFYPSVNLLAVADFNAIGIDRVFDIGSKQAGVGAAVHLPLFDAGRLRAGYRGKAADLDAAIASYNAAVVEAVHDAADQIAVLRAIEREQVEQRQAQDAAEDAYALAVARYRSGIGSYLVVLSAETGVLAQRRGEVDLKGRAVIAQAELMRALGGGYGTPAPPVQ